VDRGRLAARAVGAAHRRDRQGGPPSRGLKPAGNHSAGLVDISEGAIVSIPAGGGRYVSATVVNQDHYINRGINAPGKNPVSVEEFETPGVTVAARILVDLWSWLCGERRQGSTLVGLDF
jgi:hypothetical protein